ncbi:DUF1311 domain-containing protein [Clostridium tertium]|uniref:Lysozyme inhibitor LprI-like N-terminal domain-containing protein n=1 Tax=Clostridium tertium TaxID=1559 RepID=A0A6N3GCA0_9CLOT
MSKITKVILCIASASILFLSGCSNSTSNKNEDKNSDTIITSSEDKNNKQDDSNNRQDSGTAKEDESTRNNDYESIKQIYLDKLNELQANLDTSLKAKYDSGVTLEMVEAASEEYEKWDDMLNEVYFKLKEQLSEDEMDKLTQEELNWIQTRDEKRDAADDGYEDGSIAPFLRIDSMAKSTKERCYELVNNYMK